MPRSRRRGGRRAIEASRRASVETRPSEQEIAPLPRPGSPTRTPLRGRGAPPRPGTGRATGAPSAALERAAALERGYVMKDFRRIAVTVAVVVVLLVVAGLLENALLR